MILVSSSVMATFGEEPVRDTLLSPPEFPSSNVSSLADSVLHVEELLSGSPRFDSGENLSVWIGNQSSQIIYQLIFFYFYEYETILLFVQLDTTLRPWLIWTSLSNSNRSTLFKKASFNYLTTNKIYNKFDIIYYKPNYAVIGNVYDGIKLIKDITDTETNANFFGVFEEINSKININLKKVYFDNENIAQNFNGSLKLKKNKIVDLDLYSNFSDKDKFFITIKMSDSNQKITTLYSDRAVPFVKNFKFIKGFENGVLDYNSRESSEVVKSQVKIYDFKVKEVPILAKLLTLASLQGIADLLTGEGIRFDEFEMNYSTKDKLTLYEVWKCTTLFR